MTDSTQGIRQAAFFHGTPIDDERYDYTKDVINGELVPVERDEEEKGQDEGGGVTKENEEVEYSLE